MAILSSLSCEIKQDILVQNKLSNYLTFLPIIALILITGFRAYDVGTDTGSYYLYLWLQEPEVRFNGEFLFPLFTSMLHLFDLSYTYFLLSVAIIFFYFIYKSLKNYTEFYKANLLISFFSFMSFFYFTSLSINVIRQGASLAILLYAYSLFITKSSLVVVISFCLLALAFHLTSIIPIILFLMAYLVSIKNSKIIKFLVPVYFFGIALSFINVGFQDIAPFLEDILSGDRRISYLSGEAYDYTVAFKPQFVAFNTFFLFLALFIRKKIENKKFSRQYNAIVIYYILTSLLLFFAFQFPYSDRWGLFSWVTIPFLITPLFYSPYVKGQIKIHFVLMLILIYVGFKFYEG